MAQARTGRRVVPFALGLLAILAVVPLGWWLFLREPPPPLPPPPVAPVDAGQRQLAVRLAEVKGAVELRRGGAWVPAAEGDVLNPRDGLRTADGSYAVMVGEELWEVKMEPGTEVEIGELSESISQLLLSSGMARATVRGRRAFEVKSTQGDVAARSDGGVFTIASNGAGTVAVGAESGEVAFLGKGRVVIVRAGQESIVHPGEAPSEPTPIPASLLLKVALPARNTVNTPKLVVKGRVRPGSMVEVHGHVVTVDRQGRFELPLSLTEGDNPVEVRARGVGGATAESAHQLELDTTVKAPQIDRNLWK